MGEQEGTLLVERQLRSRVSFAQVNLNTELPRLGSFDVIFLRNVMIYFNGDTKRQVVARVLSLLKPGGHFCIGHSESLNEISTAVRPGGAVDLPQAVNQRETVRMNPIKVMVVDDSAVVRQVVTGPARRGARHRGDRRGGRSAARDRTAEAAMARRDRARRRDAAHGRHHLPAQDHGASGPTPVVICSTLTEKGAKTTLEALAAGAVAIITKPKLGLKQFLNEASDDLVATVRARGARQRAAPGAARRARRRGAGRARTPPTSSSRPVRRAR